ncbi:YtxH domain-containing protein [Sphaerobacter thermophilus]|uniref:Sporulation domain protein n=1 Tax=Sphaerobacter thermophilus (strain ATCC 49802 / DSM 20745 / KCCM 41009 / NCIMB 13125 / S 6022) TaxID=479434 RepID=D1C4P8_SPHTD|nr:YtxH domain-containing protein [Sphaerobacter thermophilus]ACZ39215.1 sporulation domain protein [Sphaerobacter thermophilus DSM 20745]PZN64258.1 MAG: YtxH domain-containing protein [Sphaerobacter thermophilus]
MADDRGDGAFIAGVVLGAIASASATLWLTPRSGEEVRAEIARRARELEQRAREAAAQVPVLSDLLATTGEEPAEYPYEMTPPPAPTPAPEPAPGPESAAEVTTAMPTASPATADETPAATEERSGEGDLPAGRT